MSDGGHGSCEKSGTVDERQDGGWGCRVMRRELAPSQLWGSGCDRGKFFANIGENLCNNTVHFGAKYAF